MDNLTKQHNEKQHTTILFYYFFRNAKCLVFFFFLLLFIHKSETKNQCTSKNEGVKGLDRHILQPLFFSPPPPSSRTPITKFAMPVLALAWNSQC